jgi:hypothetical protein
VRGRRYFEDGPRAIGPLKKRQSQQERQLAVCVPNPARNEALSAIVRGIGHNIVRRRSGRQKIYSGLAKTTVIEIGTANRLAGFLQNARGEFQMLEPSHRLLLAFSLPKDPPNFGSSCQKPGHVFSDSRIL